MMSCPKFASHGTRKRKTTIRVGDFSLSLDAVVDLAFFDGPWIAAEEGPLAVGLSSPVCCGMQPSLMQPQWKKGHGRLDERTAFLCS